MAMHFTREQFENQFHSYLSACDYSMHPQYNVFHTYGSEAHYQANPNAFKHKYRIFATVAKTLSPTTIVELGTCAGASAHAYLHGAPQARYIGYDLFNTSDKTVWDPLGTANKVISLVTSNFELIKEDFRNLTSLPSADFVVVDGAHDFHNAYLDLNLAFTSNPTYIWVDDYNGHEVAEAVGWAGRVKAYAWWCKIDYCDGGILLKLR